MENRGDLRQIRDEIQRLLDTIDAKLLDHSEDLHVRELLELLD